VFHYLSTHMDSCGKPVHNSHPVGSRSCGKLSLSSQPLKCSKTQIEKAHICQIFQNVMKDLIQLADSFRVDWKKIYPKT
jgi:hypothetical protein